ncbi:MAG: hypothetical protein ACRDJN_09895 [Chloroflexota bacterium]
MAVITVSIDFRCAYADELHVGLRAFFQYLEATEGSCAPAAPPPLTFRLAPPTQDVGSERGIGVAGGSARVSKNRCVKAIGGIGAPRL